MKYLLVLIPLFSFGQRRAGIDSIPKETNFIKVYGVGFHETVDHLLDVGYSIDKIDSNFKTISTEFKTLKSGFDISYDLRVKDSVLYIRAYCANGNYSFGRVTNLKWGVWKVTFTAMNNFANWFNKPLEYIKE